MAGGDVSGAEGAHRRLILVSNRGPIVHHREDGERLTRRGGGGLVTALTGLAADLIDAVWVCAAMTEEDAVVAAEAPGGVPYDEETSDGLRVRMVALDDEAREQFYGVIANPLLWFIQHYLYDLTRSPSITRKETDAFERGYAVVNAAIADVVAEEVQAAESGATVMVHDYHFYLLPALVRARCPQVVLHHFVHIPWPQPDSWRVLPPAMRTAVFEGVLGNDIVGFHTERYARNFLLGCQELLGLHVDLDEMSVEHKGRRVAARWYPISINPEAFEEQAASEGVADYDAALAASRREHLVVRVDRTDPSKNIVRGFEAFGILLGDHPELSGRVTFLALLQPSRLEVDEYALYLDRIRRVVADVNLERNEALVAEVNQRHGTTDWMPIDLRLRENLEEAIAAYKHYDLLMVNAMFDGMNLVAKEGPLVNERHGVSLLSENTGAHEELAEFAVSVNPFDVQEQADAIHRALTMSADERSWRAEGLKRVVEARHPGDWVDDQLIDIEAKRAGRAPAD